MYDDLLYQIALNEVPHIGDVVAKSLVNIYGTAAAIFKAPLSQLEKIEGIGTIRARSIKAFKDFDACEEEIKFVEKNKIQPLFVGTEQYPRRLLNCADSPTLLYYKGAADLNNSKIISIVGTRDNSEYGKHETEKLLQGLASTGALIVSGLAYGIDTVAHRSALKNNLPTLAVVAHGLDRIYPSQNTALAREIIKEGGLLTEFRKGVEPDRQNFPLRNRIVAGICDALVVIESGIKGGSLITAMLANGYNKDVFALPGKTTDAKSEGCNHFIKTNKALLYTDAADIIQTMGWEEKPVTRKHKQRQLFVELTPAEQKIIDALNEKENIHVDELCAQTQMTTGAVAAALLSLEMQNILLSMPGKRYKLL
jgi:DNA processing protein